MAIARALINRPPLILADEPTGNLDSRAGAAILDLLLELREQQQITVVMATHDVDVASRCDRMLRLVDGRVRDDLDMSSVSDPDATWRRLARLAPSAGQTGRSTFPLESRRASPERLTPLVALAAQRVSAPGLTRLVSHPPSPGRRKQRPEH